MIPSCPCAGEPVDELPLSSDDQQRSLLPLLPPSHFTSLTLKSQRAVLPDTFPPLTTSQCLTILNTAVLP